MEKGTYVIGTIRDIASREWQGKTYMDLVVTVSEYESYGVQKTREMKIGITPEQASVIRTNLEALQKTDTLIPIAFKAKSGVNGPYLGVWIPKGRGVTAIPKPVQQAAA